MELMTDFNNNSKLLQLQDQKKRKEAPAVS